MSATVQTRTENLTRLGEILYPTQMANEYVYVYEGPLPEPRVLALEPTLRALRHYPVALGEFLVDEDVPVPLDGIIPWLEYAVGMPSEYIKRAVAGIRGRCEECGRRKE
jgi:hypothetical protein